MGCEIEPRKIDIAGAESLYYVRHRFKLSLEGEGVANSAWYR